MGSTLRSRLSRPLGVLALTLVSIAQPGCVEPPHSGRHAGSASEAVGPVMVSLPEGFEWHVRLQTASATDDYGRKTRVVERWGKGPDQAFFDLAVATPDEGAPVLEEAPMVVANDLIPNLGRNTPYSFRTESYAWNPIEFLGAPGYYAVVDVDPRGRPELDSEYAIAVFVRARGHIVLLLVWKTGAVEPPRDLMYELMKGMRFR